MMLKVRAFVAPAAGSLTFTDAGPPQAADDAGTVAESVVEFTNVVASALPLKLITDCEVKPLPVAVSETDPEPAVTATGLSSVKVNAGRLGSSKLHAPRPCVAAMSVRDVLRSLSDITSEFGKPLCSTDQEVAPPAVAFVLE